MEIKPQMTMCPEGHFYNAAKHASCPLCAAEAASAPSQTAKLDDCGGSFSPTVAPENAGPEAVPFTPTIAPEIEPIASASFSPTIAPEFVSPSPGFSPTIAPDFEPFDAPTAIGSEWDTNGGFTVGWLVCIEGPARGSDYRLRAGYNYIGRDIGDIAIRGDQQISRQNHAMIAFDDSDCTYYVGPAAGRNLIKVNGKAVLSPVDLKNFDIISIGSTKLLFVALCGEHFSWNKEPANV